MALNRAGLGILTLGILMLVYTIFPAAAQQKPPTITEIEVLGNKVLNRESIVSASGLQIGQPVSQGVLDEAKRRLLAMGNFGTHKDNPEQGVVVRATVTGETAKVTIDVDENDQVKTITITGYGPISPEEILAKMEPMQGLVLNLPRLQRNISKVRQMYEDRGYQAFVSEDIGIKEGVLTIPIVVGRIGDLKVTNLKKTREFVVTREMRQKKSSYFNTNELRRDLQRVLNTDLFENIEPSLGFPEPGKVDVTLNVQEKRTGTVELAVGYGSRGLIGRAGVGETNFMGRGQQMNVLWETGGRANRSSYELHFTEPWMDKRNTSLSVDLFDKVVYRFAQRIESVGTPFEDDSGIYYETHTGGQITLSRPFSDAFRGFVGIRHDNVRVPNIQLEDVDRRILQNGPLSGINLKVTHNTRDFDQEPAAGGFEIYTGDIGRANLKPVGDPANQPVGGIFGNLTYTRYGVDARRYFSPQGRRQNPKDRRTVIALRIMAASSTGTLPFSEQYFVGGAESLRGYTEDRFWGKNMFLASAEYRHPLAPSLTGVVFFDMGDAWGGPYKDVNFSGFVQHANFRPSPGYGIGLRVVTPIGPIRIDQAFGREGTRTHFSIGHVF